MSSASVQYRTSVLRRYCCGGRPALGAQPLYDVDVYVSSRPHDSSSCTCNRRIGFRYFAIVTGNDTDDGVRAEERQRGRGTDSARHALPYQWCAHLRTWR